MPLYGNVIYGSGETYGQPATLPFSVEPFNALALWYDKVSLTWAPSDSNFTGFRLVRNQDAFPETSEDGIILYEWTAERGVDKSSIPISYTDGTSEDVALTPGKFIYYRIWLFDDTEVWVVGGETAIPLPQRFNDGSSFSKTTHEKLLELIPRQFTSADGSPNGSIDYSSELSAFLEGFSFSLDEILTDLSFLQPPFYGAFLNPATLTLQGNQLGVTPETGTVTRQQKKTVREAMYIYQRKGTAVATGNFAESTTGYVPTVRVSPNILLSIEDSSFYKGTGNWSVLGPALLLSKATGDTPIDQPNACDLTYVAEVEVAEAGARIALGILNPILYGAPVKFGTKYKFSFAAKTTAVPSSITPRINWYNYKGELLSSSEGTPTSPGIMWQRGGFDAFAPGYVGEFYAVTVASGTAQAYLSTPHPFQVGDSILVSDAIDGLAGTKTITAVDSVSISFATTLDDFIGAPLTGKVQASDWAFATSATYATVELQFNEPGIYYIDMVQLADASISDYSEARCVGVMLAPSKINYLHNPSFLSTGEAWTLDAAASNYIPTDIEGVYGGLNMLEVTPNVSGITSLAAAPTESVPSADFYSFSIYGKTDTGTQEVDVTITATEQPSGIVLATRTETYTLSEIWSRPSASIYVPESELTVYLDVKVEATDATSDLYFECAQLEASLSPTDYIDGSMPPAYGSGWYGTEHASPSFAYVNKESRLARLTSEIHKFIPFGGSYRVLTESGVELTEITY